MAQKSLQQQFPIDRKTIIDDMWMRALLGVLESRISGIESKSADFDSAVQQLLDIGLKRINEFLLPATEEIRKITELGFLVASSQTSAVIVEGATTAFTILEGAQRDLFTPSVFTILTRETTLTDYAVMRTLSYNKETGVYIGTMVAVSGGPGPFNDWTIGALAGSTIAQIEMLAESRDLRDESVAAAGVAVISKLDAQQSKDLSANYADQAYASRNAASGSAQTAGTRASAADASASLAGDFANKAEDSPVLPGLFSAYHWYRKALAVSQSVIAGFAGSIHAATAKNALADADEFGIADSAASWGLKKITWLALRLSILAHPSIDVASAATTNIGAASSFVVRITGTTAITSLGNDPAVAVGTLRLVQFAGALTLTNNSNLITSVGENIQTGSGDYMLVRYEGGGVWRVIWYRAPLTSADWKAGAITRPGMPSPFQILELARNAIKAPDHRYRNFNVTGSRAIGTFYLNDSDYPLIVNITLAGTGNADFRSGPVASPGSEYGVGSVGGGAVIPFTAWVAPHDYYGFVNISGSRTINIWSEYKLPS